MTNESEPHLRAVPTGTPAEGAPEADESEKRSTPLWAWVALAAFVFCAVGWYTAYQSGVALRGELAQTQATLAETEAGLAAHEAHLGVVREQTDALVTSIGSLATDAEALAAKAAETPKP